MIFSVFDLRGKVPLDGIIIGIPVGISFLQRKTCGYQKSSLQQEGTISILETLQ